MKKLIKKFKDFTNKINLKKNLKKFIFKVAIFSIIILVLAVFLLYLI